MTALGKKVQYLNEILAEYEMDCNDIKLKIRQTVEGRAWLLKHCTIHKFVSLSNSCFSNIDYLDCTQGLHFNFEVLFILDDLWELD